MKVDKNIEYANQIAISIKNLFIENEEERIVNNIDFEELKEEDNLTEFFIGYLKAGTLIFNDFTGEDKNNLEFTHLLNQLCVQDLVKRNNPEKLEGIDENRNN